MKYALLILVVISCPAAGGCAWSFTGKRTVDWTISAPGFSIGCKSAVDGQYQPTAAGVAAKDLTPEERADALVPVIRQAIIQASQTPAKKD